MIEFVPCPELKVLTKTLNLTKWGQIRLSPFSGVILSQVINSFKKLSKEPNNPFDWVFMAAKTLSESHGIHIDWDKFYALKEQHKMPDSAQMILPKVVRTSVNPESFISQRDKDKSYVNSLKDKAKDDPIFNAKVQGFMNLMPDFLRH